jgi:hypothetical protein
MSSETRREILDIIGEVDFNTGFDLMNMLYGLFDGYLYDDLLPVANGYLTNDEFLRLSEIVNVVEKYPKFLH